MPSSNAFHVAAFVSLLHVTVTMFGAESTLPPLLMTVGVSTGNAGYMLLGVCPASTPASSPPSAFVPESCPAPLLELVPPSVIIMPPPSSPASFPVWGELLLAVLPPQPAVTYDVHPRSARAVKPRTWRRTMVRVPPA